MVTPKHRIRIASPDLSEEAIEAVATVLRSGRLAQGSVTADFERAFAQLVGARHGIAIANGSAAIELALQALDIGPGDSVIVPAFTFVATASAVARVGATPIFADVKLADGNLDPQDVERRWQPSTRAVIGVHLYGQPCDIQSLSELCAERQAVFLADAAQAHGAHYQGRPVGAWATSTWSFYATKNLGLGEGGMVTTNDDQLAAALQALRNHGSTERYIHERLSSNFRMTDITAAIGLAQLPRLNGHNAARQTNAAYYDQHLAGVLPLTRWEDRTHVYHQYTVRCQDPPRDALQAALDSAGIDSAVHYPVPLHRQPIFAHAAADTPCPNSDTLAQEVLSLPVHPRVRQPELGRVVDAVNALAH